MHPFTLVPYYLHVHLLTNTDVVKLIASELLAELAMTFSFSNIFDNASLLSLLRILAQNWIVSLRKTGTFQTMENKAEVLKHFCYKYVREIYDIALHVEWFSDKLHLF